MSPFDKPVPLELTKALLDFKSPGFEPETALAQAQGATALYNILAKQRLAYLADEVGMGKTYQAFGVLSLLWHHAPGASVLVIAPNESVQDKWIADYQSFVERNVRVRDDRIRDGITGGPTHPARKARNLVELVHARFSEPSALIVGRMSSFSALGRSLGIDADSASSADIVAALHHQNLYVPPVGQAMNYNGSRAISTAAAGMVASTVPRFDLIVVDESQALRNRGDNIRTHVFAAFLGLRPPGRPAEPAPNGSPRLLLMSATPAYRRKSDIYNQLAFLRQDAEQVPEERKDEDEYLRQFFVRRLRLFHGKNKYDYRRPRAKARELGAANAVEELFLALVQKELEATLDERKRLGTALKIGFLETFESYKPSIEFDPELRSLASDDEVDEDNQTKDFDEEASDAPDTEPLSKLVQDYRAALGDDQLPPHPKQMMIEELAEKSFSAADPQKALIFVRRLASVRELARRISSVYDRVVLRRLSTLLDQNFDRPHDFVGYVHGTLSSQPDEELDDEDLVVEESSNESRSLVLDTFTSRKGDPRRGHRFRRRFNMDQPLAGVFEENLVRFWFESCECCAGHDYRQFAKAHFGDAVIKAASILEARGDYFRQKKFLRTRARWLVQQTALLAAADYARDRHDDVGSALARELAQVVSLIGAGTVRPTQLEPSMQNREHVQDLLLEQSFWDFVRAEPATSALGTFLATGWSEHDGNLGEALRRREAIRNVVDKNIRMGEGILAIFVAYVRALEADPERRFVEPFQVAARLRNIFLGTSIDGQRLRNRTARYLPIADQLAKYLYGAGRTQSQPKFLETNLTEFNDRAPVNMVMGGSGSRKQSIVQFNSPFIPDFIVSTNVLQEGVDLHLSCNSVWHYGLASTPGSIEQRVGRVDRYYSMAHRALAAKETRENNRTLEVVFPYLARSVDEHQLVQVLSRIRHVQPLMDRGLHHAATGNDVEIDDPLRGTVKTILKDIEGIGESVPSAPFDPSCHYKEIVAFDPPRNAVANAEEYVARLRQSLRRTFERLSPPSLSQCTEWRESSPNAVWLVWGNIPLTVVAGRSELAQRLDTPGALLRDQPISVSLVFVPSLGRRVLRLETPLGPRQEKLEVLLRRELLARKAHLCGFRLRSTDLQSNWGFTLVHDFPDVESPLFATTLESFAKLADEVERAVFERDIRYEPDHKR